jgi:hypothetical protein
MPFESPTVLVSCLQAEVRDNADRQDGSVPTLQGSPDWSNAIPVLAFEFLSSSHGCWLLSCYDGSTFKVVLYNI